MTDDNCDPAWSCVIPEGLEVGDCTEDDCLAVGCPRGLECRDDEVAGELHCYPECFEDADCDAGEECFDPGGGEIPYCR